MGQIPFIGAAYEGRSKNLNGQRAINLYPEIDEAEGKNVIALYGTPGLELFAYLGALPIRGMRVMGTLLYVVQGGKLYSVSTAAVKTELGTLDTSSGRVSMDDNGTQMMLVDGTSGYIYTPSTSTFAKITDPDFPVSDMVTFIDGYFVFNVAGTGTFGITGLYDGSTVDALDIATAEANPDDLLAVTSDHRELWLFGEETTEVWYDSGNADFPFERMNGALIEKGIAAKWSVAKADNSLFWLAKDRNGFLGVVRADGYQPRIVSTRAIEYQISQYSDVSDAYAYAYSEEGHTFYVLTFPTGNATWVYDAATGLWHERSSYGIGRHRANVYARFNGFHMVGDSEDGDVYKMEMDVYTDNGDPIERIRRTQHTHKDGTVMFFNSIQVDMETGTGDLNYTGDEYLTYFADGSAIADGDFIAGGELIPGGSVNPQAMLRWSDDGGHTFSTERWVAMGKQGQFGKRAVWRRLGKSRDRVFELKITDPIKIALVNAYADIEGGLN